MAIEKLPILFRRTKMLGTINPCCSYDVYVPLKSLPLKLRSSIHHATVFDGIDYVSVPVAMMTRRHAESPCGFDKLRAWNEHEKDTAKFTYNLAIQVFPELVGIGYIPSLWVDMDLPSESVVRELYIPIDTAWEE